ncbi:MAG: TetR/AcrR family transcriptional regulator [Sphingomonadaceae bacterium]|nr:TetR/AcrR family transcriptional regulator [Sphingomonadaceae bacterium]
MPPRQTAKTVRKPVRRARQARSQATVEVIVEAAARILADKGWRGLTTNAVAQRAGVSIGSVYEYFANKQAIIDVILDRHIAQGETYIAGLADLPAGSLTAGDIVEATVGGFIIIHRDNPKLHRVISSEVPLSENQKARVDQLRNRAISLVSRLLEGQTNDPNVKASMVVDTAEALTHRWIVDEAGVPVAAETMTNELTAMLRLYVSG